MAKINLLPRTRENIALLLSIGLILTFSVGVFAAEGDATDSQLNAVDYDTMTDMVQGVTEADAEKEAKTEALEGLFDGLIDHLEQENLPEGTVDKVRDGLNSLNTLHNANMIDSNQLSEQASNIVKNTERKDPDGKIPTASLENSGIGEKVSEIAKNASDPKQIGTRVRNTVKEMVEAKKQNRVRGEDKEKGEEEIEKAEEEKREEAEDKEGKGRENGNGNGNGKAKGKGAAGSENAAVNAGKDQGGNFGSEEVEDRDKPSKAGNGERVEPDNPGRSNEARNGGGKPDNPGRGSSEADKRGKEKRGNGNKGKGKGK